MYKGIGVVLYAALLLAGLTGSARGAAYYVSPSGNDTNSGTISSPFLTIQHAITVAEASATKTIYVRQGQYFLNGGSITLGSADSGLQLLGYPGEAPILSGGYKVTNWQSEASITGAYSAPLPTGFSASSPSWMQPTVTINGAWYDCARSPNLVATDRYRSGFFFVNTPVNPSWPPDYGTDKNFTVRGTDINSTNYNSETYAGIALWDKLGWQFDPLPITSVSFGSPTSVTLLNGSTFGISNNSRYYLYGTKGSLDVAGEFWVDRVNSRLWVIPIGGTNPGSSTVVISPSEGPAVIEIDGASKVLISGFQIRDQNNTSRWAGTGYAKQNGGVRVDNGDGNTIQNNTFSCVGIGVDLEGPTKNGSGVVTAPGATNCVIRGNEISNTCAGAIKMGGSNTAAGNKAIANYIHDTGLIEQGSHAITSSPAPNYIGYNRIVNVPHFAIACGDAATASNGLLVEYNAILRSSQGDDDTGAIYLKNGGSYNSSAPEVIRYNYIDDTGGAAGTSSGTINYPNSSYGIYMDSGDGVGQSGTQVYGNLVNHFGFGGAFAHNGHDNNIYNNIFANGANFQLVMQSNYSPATNIFTKNIFYFGTTTNPFKVFWNTAGTVTGETANSYNLFWDYADTNHNYYWSPWADYYNDSGTYLNTKTYTQWQAIPKDTTSVQSDPLFVGNPPYSSYFALTSASPAFSLGFTQLPLQQMGLQGYGNAATHINVGGSASWPFAADSNYTGGSLAGYADTIDTSAPNAAPTTVYQTERYGTIFSYTFSGFTPGSPHTVRLHFVEQYWGIAGRGGTVGAGKRQFNVAINSTSVLSNFDVYAITGGANIADVEQLNTTANSSGQIIISFTGGSSTDPNAMVSGIEIDPAGQSSAIHIHSGGTTVGPFVTDTDYTGGSTYSYADTIDTSAPNAAPGTLYNSVRYGTSFSYTIPGLQPGSLHAVRLHFVELTYGIPARGGGGIGSRFFNVAINGTQMLSNFDIYAAAGAADKAVVATIPVTANSSGQIILSFSGAYGSPDQNATISGIEVY